MNKHKIDDEIENKDAALSEDESKDESLRLEIDEQDQRCEYD